MIEYLIIFVLAGTVFLLLYSEKFTEYVLGINVDKININGKDYNVSDDFQNKKTAGHKMERITNDIKTLTDFMSEKYKSGEIKKRIDNFKRRWNEKRFYEGSPNGKDSSYTIGKGDYFVICLRDKNGNLHDRITLLFVVLHEMAHIVNDNYGHGSDFWEIFRWLLSEAEECFSIKFPQYDKNPKMYCNTKITSNPLYM